MGSTAKKYKKAVEKLKDRFSKIKKEYPKKTNKELGALLSDELGKSPHHIAVMLGVYDKLYSNLSPKQVEKGNAEGVSYDSETDDDFEERSIGEAIRNEEGVITHYFYEIQIRDKAPLKGIFSREEMDTVYRLYSSNDGANLNQRSVSREFPEITFRDFKRILRAFYITKDAVPVAPHVLEENDASKVAEIIRQNKENVVLKKLEEDRSKYFEKLWRKTLSSLIELKENREYGQEYLQELIKMEGADVAPLRIKKTKLKNGKVGLNFYLADIHMGAKTLKDSLYKNPWNEKEALKTVEYLIKELRVVASLHGRIATINLIHLGDGVDGKDGKTTRDSGHHLPQNMDNKQQIRAWIKLMKLTLDAVHEEDVADEINFYTTTDDNHSGDFLYGAYLALEEFCTWKYPDMGYEMFEKFIGHFDSGIHTFVCTHGKDKIHMRNGMPLALDTKTENKIIEYLEAHNIFHPNVHFIKADLHQSARQSVARFDYKNVYSVYGASAWIHTNFGIGQPGLDYDIYWLNEDRILEGRIKFKRGSIWKQY